MDEDMLDVGNAICLIPKYFGQPFNPLKWLGSNFSSQYHPWIKYQGHKNKRKSSPTKAGPDCLTNSPCQYLKNVWGTVWRICLLILGCKGLKDQWS